MKTREEVRPFVKWAGGKSQLLDVIRLKYPANIKRYCEPFLGGGAVLFDIIATFQPEEVLVNDINKDLINTYKQLQKHCDDIIEQLNRLQAEFWSTWQNQRREMYLQLRDEYNSLEVGQNSEENLRKAVLLIFLNKTCFNGLYRVNSKGQFNVPMGSYDRPLICDPRNLRHCSALLQNVRITCDDYASTIGFVDHETFVYLDPPYRPISLTASFTAYNETVFTDREQRELAAFVDSIASKGAKIVLSNSDPKNTNPFDSFFDDLYSRYIINRIDAKRMINSKASKRGTLKELLICNF